MCCANWSYKTDCYYDCTNRIYAVFEGGNVISQHEILAINSGGAANIEEMNEAHQQVNTFKGYQ